MAGMYDNDEEDFGLSKDNHLYSPVRRLMLGIGNVRAQLNLIKKEDINDENIDVINYKQYDIYELSGTLTQSSATEHYIYDTPVIIEYESIPLLQANDSKKNVPYGIVDYNFVINTLGYVNYPLFGNNISIINYISY
jgi:hypothetical protein